MKKSIALVIFVVTFAGCKGPTAPVKPSATPAPRAVVSQPSPVPREGEPSPTATPLEEADYHTEVAVYDSCAVYATATDFYFKTDSGQRLSFRNSNLPEEPKTVQVSVSLLDDAGSSEGPPGANPQWVGKKFLLTVNEKDEIVALEPMPEESEAGAGESNPENAQLAVEAQQESMAHPELPVALVVPHGFEVQSSASHEGEAVFLEGGGGTVHIFLPNPEVSLTGEESVIGAGGLLESNGWSTMEAGRAAQPSLPWASGTYPFFGPEELEGAVWVGQLNGREVRVTVSAPPDEIDSLYGAVGPMLQGMQLRP